MLAVGPTPHASALALLMVSCNIGWYGSHEFNTLATEELISPFYRQIVPWVPNPIISSFSCAGSGNFVLA